MHPDLDRRLQTLSQNGRVSVYLKPPCSGSELEQFTRRLQQELGHPDGASWYLPLLRLSNGLQIENAMFDSADELIANTLEHRRHNLAHGNRFVVFGNSGNVDIFVFDLQARSRPFLVANFFGDVARPEEVFESFATLDELIGQLLDREEGT